MTPERINEAIRKLDEVQFVLKGILRESQTDLDPDFEFLDCRLDSLDFGDGLNARVRTVFSLNELATVRDLVALSEAEFLRIPNVGNLTLARIKVILTEHGLRFAP